MLINKGILFGFIAAFCFSLMGLCVKAVHLPAQEVVFARSIITALATWFMLRRQRIYPWGLPAHRKMLILRGLAGYVALSAYFFSLNGLALGVAALIQYLSPLFSSLLAFFSLKEVLSWPQIFCLLSGLLGIGFITELLPTLAIVPTTDWSAVLICLASALLSSVAYLLVRRLSLQGEDSNVIIFYFALVSLPFASLFMLIDFVWPTGWWEWFLLLAVGLTSHFGQLALTYGLKAAAIAPVTNMLYFAPVLASAWGVIFLAERITWHFLLGAVLIIGGQLLLLRRKREPI